MKIGPVQARADIDPLPAGALLVSKKSVLVGTATHAVELGWVQATGKRAMPAADWARGLRIGSDAVFA